MHVSLFVNSAFLFRPKPPPGLQTRAFGPRPSLLSLVPLSTLQPSIVSLYSKFLARKICRTYHEIIIQYTLYIKVNFAKDSSLELRHRFVSGVKVKSPGLVNRFNNPSGDRNSSWPAPDHIHTQFEGFTAFKLLLNFLRGEDNCKF